MKVKLEEELCEAQEAKQRQDCQLLDKLCKQPPLGFNTPDMSEEYRSSERQEPELPCVKEEESTPPGGKEEEELQQPNIKQEEHLLPCIKEEKDFTELPVTGVHVKSEDGQNEEKKGAGPLKSRSSQRMTTAIDDENCGESKADDRLAPMSDDDDATSRSSHTDDDADDEESEVAMTYHAGSTRWKCSQCGKTFGYKTHLKRHKMGHTGEKPFACSFCGKRFSRKEHLKVHTKIHTGEKPFACSICGKRFIQNVQLRLHTQTHTGKKPCACSVCGEKFSCNANMEIHTRTHTSEKPFACSVCGQRFQSKSLAKWCCLYSSQE